VTDDEIDDILNRAASMPHEVDPRLLDRIGESIRPALSPVRPLPSPVVLAAALAGLCVLVGVAGAAHLGFAGFHKMNTLQGAVIFPVLGAFVWLAAWLSATEHIPGCRRSLTPGALLALCSLTLLAIFVSLFHDYGTDRFVAQGMTCLTAGLLHAVPTAGAAWIILRRGFAVDPLASALASGTLAGLAGVLMLELHCPNFEAPHVMLWHMAVIWVASAAAAGVAITIRATSTSKHG